MLLIILLLILILVLGGVGFAVHVLWPIAIVLLILWLLGFAFGRGASRGTHGWYRW